jgi:hypothetical protein
LGLGLRKLRVCYSEGRQSQLQRDFPPAFSEIAGAFYGAEQIPSEWRAKLTMLELIIEFSDKLYAPAN